MKALIFIAILLTPSIVMADSNGSQLSPKEVRISSDSGSALVTGGRCQGLVGNSFNHAAVRCHCLITLGAKVGGNGNVDTRGVSERSWDQCVADGLQKPSRVTLPPSDNLRDERRNSSADRLIKEANQRENKNIKSTRTPTRKPLISDGE